GAAEESRAGAEIAKHKTNEQTALFATNSGRRLLNAGDIDGAISQFRTAIQAVPGYAPAHYQLGLALQRKGDKGGPAPQFTTAACVPIVVSPARIRTECAGFNPRFSAMTE